MSVEAGPAEVVEREGSSLSVETPISADSPETLGDYRSMSTLAMASFGLGMLSVLSLISLALGIVPMLGMALGTKAWITIRRNPSELTGEFFAKLGVGLSAFFLFGGWIIMAVEYYTEVPDPRFTRINYALLQSEDANNPIPKSAVDLDGQSVFIKGYMYQGQSRQVGIKRFILCADNGACCFGGPKPKLNDMIQVNIVNGGRANYSSRLFKIAGTFRVQRQMGEGGEVGEVLYNIDAEYVK